MQEKLNDMKAKFLDMKLRTKAHDEAKHKKATAMSVWAQLEKQTQAMEGGKKSRTPGAGPDADEDRSPLDEKKKLEADLSRTKDASATKLAEEILGGKEAQ